MTLLRREWGRGYWLPIVFRRTARLTVERPLISLTFDDFPRSAYTVGGAIMKSMGVRGTFYTAYGLMNTTHATSGELFQLDDLYGLTMEGHELASHTLNHVSSRSLSTGSFVEQVLQGRASLQRLSGVPVTDNFAYPFGAVTGGAKRALGRCMLSCRSIYQGVNGPIVDLNLLRANPLYGDAERMDLIRQLMDTNERIGGWLIFYTHDVQNRPSRYGCTPRLLETVVRLALDRSMKIATVNEVLTLTARKHVLN